LAPSSSKAQHFLTRHRRGITTAIVVLSTGFAVTAFGIAPLAPDAAQLPRRVITESVTPENLEAQVDALGSQLMQLVRNDVTRGTDSPDALLARLGVRDAAAASFLRSDPTARKLLAGRSGKMVQARTREDGRLIELIARYPAEKPEQFKTHFTRLSITHTGNQWASHLETSPLSVQVKLGSGTIRSTLFAATDDARLPDPVAAQLAEIFATDLDFHRELRKGDTFSVVYEALTADGEPIAWNEGAGRVLAAEFVNGGRPHHALWFGNEGGRGGYFGLDGRSKRRMFLASPMEFSRVTSGFAMRFHPILQNWRAHLGVDYGAPQGTPVRSVGDGTVEMAGWKNGYGNVVQVRHDNDRTTLYAHLSRMDVKKGQRVDQGQRIGAVGMTGWSTGPHLHFEFRVRGQHQDPLQVAKASEPITLDAAAKRRFAEVAQQLQAKLDVAETLVGTQGQAE